jgi:hypothetical protein
MEKRGDVIREIMVLVLERPESQRNLNIPLG